MGVLTMLNQNPKQLLSRTRPKTFYNPLLIRVQTSLNQGQRRTRKRSNQAVTRRSTGLIGIRKGQGTKTRTGNDTSLVIKTRRKIKKGIKIKISIVIKKEAGIRSTEEKEKILSVKVQMSQRVKSLILTDPSQNLTYLRKEVIKNPVCLVPRKKSRNHQKSLKKAISLEIFLVIL